MGRGKRSSGSVNECVRARVCVCVCVCLEATFYRARGWRGSRRLGSGLTSHRKLRMQPQRGSFLEGTEPRKAPAVAAKRKMLASEKEEQGGGNQGRVALEGARSCSREVGDRSRSPPPPR